MGQVRYESEVRLFSVTVIINLGEPLRTAHAFWSATH